MIFCSNCGQPNSEGVAVCSSCGTALPQTGSGAYVPPRTSDAEAQQQAGTPSWATPPYQGTPQSMQPDYSGGQMSIGQKRDPIMIIVFSLLTCGIYGIYWFYMVITEIKDALGRQDINPALEIVLGIVTCGLYFIYLVYKYPQLMLEMQSRVGLPRNDVSLISLLVTIFGLFPVAMFIIQSELNKIWDAASGRR